MQNAKNLIRKENPKEASGLTKAGRQSHNSSPPPFQKQRYPLSGVVGLGKVALGAHIEDRRSRWVSHTEVKGARIHQRATA